MARLFTVISDDTLVAMITNAVYRIVLVAPGLSVQVATALSNRLKAGNRPQELSITLDVDPETCRLGYGEFRALDLCREALESAGIALQRQEGVRIGLIVADDDVVVYSPTPQLIEAGSTSERKPNAIRISGAGPRELAFACGAQETSIPGFTQEVGLTAVSEDAVSQTKLDLDDNPPRKFDLVRLERVFNYKLEFVEFSIEGFRLNARVATLPAFILGIAEKDLKDRLRNAFRVFDEGGGFCFEITDPDDKSKSLVVDEKWFAEQAAALRKLYFIPLGSSSYGNLIQKRHKPDFLNRVQRVKTVLAEYALLVTENIEQKVKTTRESLTQSLLPRVFAAPPLHWAVRSLASKPTLEEVRRLLEAEISHAFAKADLEFSPKVNCIFKGVQYETITSDAVFQHRVLAYFKKDAVADLLSEYDASRAEEPAHTCINLL